VTGRVDYDEFGLFHENAESTTACPLTARRQCGGLRRRGRRPAAERAGCGKTGARNWSCCTRIPVTPILGHRSRWPRPSSWRPSTSRTRPLGWPRRLPGRPAGRSRQRGDVAEAVRQFAPAAKAVIGMSLGGLTPSRSAPKRPELVRKIVLVDVLPGIRRSGSATSQNFRSRPVGLPAWRSCWSGRPGSTRPRSLSFSPAGQILHNAEQQPDGTWVWPVGPGTAIPRHGQSRISRPAPASPAAGYPLWQLWETLSSDHRAAAARPGHAAGLGLDDDDERGTAAPPAFRPGHSLEESRPQPAGDHAP